MASNLDRYKKDLETLVEKGHKLLVGFVAGTKPEEFKALLMKRGQSEENAEKYIENLPSVDTYQSWYSEAQAVIKILLPDRFADFVRHYEKPKSRKQITFENYRIEDALQGLVIPTRNLGPDAAIPHLKQQLFILESVTARFESSLFDIRQLVMADLFDSEIETADELARNRFLRAAGAVSGVVLEKHLAQACENHSIKVSKNATISNLNDALKEAKVIDVPTWRFVQHLGDIRNLCDHSKKVEPAAEQISDLIGGTRKILKTLY